ncbi:MAG: Na+/H+ antiporter NhaA [Pseudoclavibacter sp.]
MPIHRPTLSREALPGVLMAAAALVALVVANSPIRAAWFDLLGLRVGPEALDLHLTLGSWVEDGLLAVFFCCVGLELKTEITTGALHSPRRALPPVCAAVGGMLAPAGVFLAIVALTGGSAAQLRGWAIPTATDIAFALGAAALLARGLPRGVRVFLLALATADDLLGILIIAFVYTDAVHLLPLGVSLLAVAVWMMLLRTAGGRIPAPVHVTLLVVLAVAAWAAMHASGVHATIAGVLLGLAVPARPLRPERAAWASAPAVLERIEPLSNRLVLPLYALVAASVPVVGAAVDAETIRIAAAVAVALLVGKPLGVLATMALLTRWGGLDLPEGVRRVRDLVPVALLTGIGFTVSLLLAELSLPDAADVSAARLGVLAGTAGAIALAAAAFRRHRRAS